MAQKLNSLKIYILLFLIFIIANNVYSAAFQPSAIRWRNDAREMFQDKKLIIFEMNPRTFSAKDLNNNGIIEPELGESFGNFIGAISRLDKIKDMGFNAIHVMPITQTGTHRALGTAGSLYSLADFTTINPKLDLQGNRLSVNTEFEIFVEECHKRNIRVIVDLPSCGSYDLYLKDPDLFLLNEKDEPISPADWFDVYAFKTLNTDGTLNEKLLELHKDFLDMIIRAKVDGIRADVATMKPYEFWKELVIFARAKNTQFLFLAEASNSWNTKHCDKCSFTPYDKLLLAGFDGYYGSYFNYKDWSKISELKNQIKLDMNLSKKYKDKKASIASFITHDEQSPVLIGGYNYATQIIWLNMVLPLNPYVLDGIQSGDNYIYPYANQTASKSYTDNTQYYVHKGKIDIFNFSRQPGGEFPQIAREIKLATNFRQYAQDVITDGSFNVVKTQNKNVFAFTRKTPQKTIFVIINKNKNGKEDLTIKYKGLFSKDNFTVIKSYSQPVMGKDKITVNLEPSEIIILYSEK